MKPQNRRHPLENGGDFGLTVLLVAVMTAVTVNVVDLLPFDLLAEWCKHWSGVWLALWLFGVVNNSYQIFTHTFTALQYIGIPLPIVPGGADEKQTPTQFTVHNQLDLWGWWAYFLLIGRVPPMENLLAAVHSSVGVVACLYPEVFQSRYISRKNDSRTFTFLKVAFVSLDAVVRMHAVWTVLTLAK